MILYITGIVEFTFDITNIVECSIIWVNTQTHSTMLVSLIKNSTIGVIGSNNNSLLVLDSFAPHKPLTVKALDEALAEEQLRT